MVSEKEIVKQYWDNEPCGTRGVPYPEGSLGYFEAIAKYREKWESFMSHYAQFDRWEGKKVLEVGCGVGSDLIRFAKAGAYVTGIDLSPKSVALTKKRLDVYGLSGVVIEADAESMPYKDDTFDYVFSHGVIHHSPDTEKTIREIHRAVKPDGEICVMIYHRRSLVALQMWLLFGLFKLRLFRSIKYILANYHESKGTKAYTIGEARKMFSMFSELRIDPVVTLYDLRYTRSRHLPYWVGKIIPKNLGWFLVIRGKK